MNHTENYQLNQWESSDRVLREDFNADNRKIDAALTENKKRVLLREIMLEADAASMEVDMSGLLRDGAYWQLEIYLDGEGSSETGAVVRFNGKASASDYTYRSFNGMQYDTSCFGSLPIRCGDYSGKGRLVLFSNAGYLGGYCEQCSGMPSQFPYGMTQSSGVTCENLTTMTLSPNSGVIRAGASLKIYGLKL